MPWCHHLLQLILMQSILLGLPIVGICHKGTLLQLCIGIGPSASTSNSCCPGSPRPRSFGLAGACSLLEQGLGSSQLALLLSSAARHLEAAACLVQAGGMVLELQAGQACAELSSCYACTLSWNFCLIWQSRC